MRFPLDADGIWLQGRGQAAAKPRPALFLDRDGVLVKEVGYLHRPDEVRLLPGIPALLRAAGSKGWAVVVVTNQSGIARGLYGWAEFQATTAEIERRLAARGAEVDLTLACPFHADGQGPYRIADHPCRKPNPGLLLKAAQRLTLDLARSWLVGDQTSDIEAAQRAGLAGAIHLASGHGRRDGEREQALALAGPGFTVFAARNAAEAVEQLAPF